MKKYSLFFTLILFILTQASCTATSIGNDIVSKYLNIFDKCNCITEIRLYNDSDETKAKIGIIKKALEKNLYASELMLINYWLKDKQFQIYAYDYLNYNQNKGILFDRNRKKVSISKLDPEQQFYNKKSNIIARKKQVYFEDFFCIPALGEKYLNRLKKEASDSYSGEDIKVKKGYSVKLIIQEPIDAKILIYTDHAVEIYRDVYKNTLTRILAPGPNIDLNNLGEVERYANQMLAKYAVLAE